ncbi:MAG: Polysaccharide pyruvyl transferase family protein WcaK [Candidatus Nitrotoga sp. CP45]|nr:MAG: Polysaccharide pyruvyl transferase family protein WcaK [Candidatus Nitrotoga sp. CP45]
MTKHPPISTHPSSFNAHAAKQEVLVLGGVTHDNRGDLAMMEGLFIGLREMSSNIAPILYSWNPKHSRTVFDVECRHSPDLDISSQFSSRSSRIIAIIEMAWFVIRFALFRFVSFRVARLFTNANLLGFFVQLSRASAVIVHGSGSFNSYWWHDWVYPKTACAIAARLAGKPILMTSQGVGPFEHVLDRLVASLFFRAATYLGVRDADQSANIMRRLGAQSSRIWQSGDNALLLPKLSDAELNILLEAEGIPLTELLIGVNVRDATSYSSSFHEGQLDKLATALSEIAIRHGARLVFIPISYDSADDDRRSAENLARIIGDRAPITVVRNERSAAELRALISRMSICVGTSYHFLLFALSSNVPAIGLFRNAYYRQKQSGLFGLFGHPELCIDTSLASASELTERIGRLMVERTELSCELERANVTLAEKTAHAYAQFAHAICATN